VRAAFRNGVTRAEIREVLLQAMIYCGVPAANSAFKQAREVSPRWNARAQPADSEWRTHIRHHFFLALRRTLAVPRLS
jgi:hypothetical protein